MMMPKKEEIPIPNDKVDTNADTTNTLEWTNEMRERPMVESILNYHRYSNNNGYFHDNDDNDDEDDDDEIVQMQPSMFEIFRIDPTPPPDANIEDKFTTSATTEGEEEGSTTIDHEFYTTSTTTDEASDIAISDSSVLTTNTTNTNTNIKTPSLQNTTSNNYYDNIDNKIVQTDYESATVFVFETTPCILSDSTVHITNTAPVPNIIENTTTVHTTDNVHTTNTTNDHESHTTCDTTNKASDTTTCISSDSTVRTTNTASVPEIIENPSIVSTKPKTKAKTTHKIKLPIVEAEVVEQYLQHL